MSYFATGAALTAALNELPASLTGTYKAFDAFYYANTYMGSYSGTLTPIEHFVQIGAARGYQPNADFNPAFYQSKYSDLAGLDAADLLFHYVKFGLNEGRAGNAALAAVNWADYLAAYPAVAEYVNANLASFANSTTNGAIAHYVKFGAQQGFALPATAKAETYKLSAGIDSAANFTGGNGNDTFIGNTDAGAVTLTSLDAIDGGAGNDSLTISATAAIDTTSAIAATVKNIESATLTSTSTINADTTAWTGLTSLTAAAADDIAVIAAATTNVTVSASDLSAGAGTELAVDGGKDVTVTSQDSLALAGAASLTAVVVGATTAAAGNVVVAHTEKATAAADAGATTGSGSTVTVTGGKTIVVTSTATAGAGDNAGDIFTIGAVGVTGDANTTSVTVSQTKSTAAWAAAGDKIKINNGAVTIADVNAASGTKAGTITAVTLNSYGNSTIDSSALTTVSLTGSGGTLGIGRGALTATPTANDLTLNVSGLTAGAITDSEAAADDGFKTVNVVATGTASTIADLTAADATALNISGDAAITFTANTGIGAVTAITVTNTKSTKLGTALGTAVAFTSGAGAETITVGATTKAITTGGGDDNITTGSALGTGGSVDAGEGVDTLTLSAADAVTASAGTTYETTVSGFDKLAIGNVAATGTVNLANIDDLNDVTVAGVAGGHALTLSNAVSGVNVRFADATQTSTAVTLANAGTADVANVFITTADNAALLGTVDLTGFETVNIATADTDTDTTVATSTITTLTAGDATSVVVTGTAGLALGAGFAGTKVTSFDASGVTVGAVTYTTGALAAAATINGGAGADTLNAASATKAVTISGGAGNDSITGSSTKGSTLNGDAGNDTITGGAAADVVDGGTGTDTFVANNAEQAGASNVTGAIVNLSDAALTQSAVFAATGKYLTSAAPSVAAGTATYLFSSESTTNDSVFDTLTSIENVTGTATADYIIGSSADNVITGAAGADVLTGGAGADTFAFGVADSVASTANTLTAGGIAANNTVTFGGGVDFISDFVAGTDKLDLTTAAAAPTTLLGVATATVLTAGTSYVAYGTYDAATGVFTIAAAFNATSAKDALVIADGNGLTAVTTTGVVVIDNLTAALAATDII